MFRNITKDIARHESGGATLSSREQAHSDDSVEREFGDFGFTSERTSSYDDNLADELAQLGAAGQPADLIADNFDGLEAELAIGDQDQLRSYERRCALLKDRVISVARRYQNGLYLTGNPGSGKTHLVRKTLEDSSTSHIYRSGRMTAMGLYDELAQHPDAVIVVDDIPSMFKDRQAIQILLAALGGEPGEPRPITCSTKNRGDSVDAFSFSGGLIAISNVPLQRDPLADALASRTTLLQHDPTDEELKAVMRSVALRGFQGMAPAECREVVEFIIEESAANDYRLDLRFMVRGWQDFRQYRMGDASCHWKELIRSSMKQVMSPEPLVVPSKREQLANDLEVVRAAVKSYPGNTARQMEHSGFKHTKFYGLRREILTSGS